MQTPSGSQEALTFVVRLWRETDAAGQRCWRGRVEHIGAGEVCYVDDTAGVVDVIERWIQPFATGGDEQGREMLAST